MLRSRTVEGNVLMSMILALCWIFVMLRVYVRTFMAKCFGTDDWLLLAALVSNSTYSPSRYMTENIIHFHMQPLSLSASQALTSLQATFTVYCSAGLLAVSHGVGKDPSIIPHSDLPSAILFWWLAVLFYNPTTLFVRLSISVFIHKLCISRTHKIIIWVTAIISIAFSVFYFFLTIFQCNPPSYFWTKYSTGTSGVCFNADIFPAATYAHSAISATGDWVLGLLPIWLIWDLQMGKRTKVSVGILLGLGVL